MSDDEILTIMDSASYLKIAEKMAYKYVSGGMILGFKMSDS